ncbi:MAG TPA: AAA family ATPase [Gemmataceae bacterium]|nr:AAA family ATPase [Gemmataceae bacterium]
MYESHFGLRQRPFRPIADSEFYYPATSYERALAQLLDAVEAEEGLALLVGDPGTGKTTIGQCLLDRLQENVSSVFLVNCHFRDRTALLQAILYDLSLPFEGKSEQELRLALTELALKNYEARRRTVLIVDEAQELTPDLLEELRLLGNLEGTQGKAIQVILLALPAILETLQLAAVACFNQRLAVRVRLECLGLHEGADYLVHRLRTAGGRPEDIISDEALEVLVRATGGIPRLLNQAAHHALTLAQSAGANLVDVEAALEALAVLGLAEDGAGKDGEMNGAASEMSCENDAIEPEAEPSTQPMLILEDDAKVDHGPHANLLKDPGRSRRLFTPPRRPA